MRREGGRALRQRLGKGGRQRGGVLGRCVLRMRHKDEDIGFMIIRKRQPHKAVLPAPRLAPRSKLRTLDGNSGQHLWCTDRRNEGLAFPLDWIDQLFECDGGGGIFHVLRVADDTFARTCRGLHRREFLRIGSLALGGLTLSQVLKVKAEEGRRLVKDKAVVLLFLQGGSSQIETFDPEDDGSRGDSQHHR